MKHQVYLFIILFLHLANGVWSEEWEVMKPPTDAGYDSFYEKYVSVDGYPVIASGKVDDYALNGHLRGYDPSGAPTFKWPERLDETRKAIRLKAESRDKGE